MADIYRGVQSKGLGYKLGVIIDHEVHSCIYKQEDVKANLLNPKSQQHLICGCSKKHECHEEKEI